MKIRTYFVVMAALLLGGCAATLDDFRQMNAHQRADYACNRHHKVVALDTAIAENTSALSETEAAISRGYRIHRHCEQKPIIVPGYVKSEKKECSTDEEDVTTCDIIYKREDPDVTYETVCEETPVAIDGTFEKQKLKEYRSTLRRQEKEVAQLYDNCYRKVQPLSVEGAFDYYLSIKASGGWGG